jgi:nucleotide-binding universal stress UspA family protein
MSSGAEIGAEAGTGDDMTSNETKATLRTASAPSPTAGEIVVGLDDSASAAAALRWAAEQSRSTGLPLRVVHAWQMTALDASTGSADLWEAAGADARARATRWVLDTLGGGAAEVRWSLDIGEGSPESVLVARSREARLLVLGTREHRGLRRAILGSVSHHCLTHADPPVVAVPAPREAQPAEAVERGVLVTPGPLL